MKDLNFKKIIKGVIGLGLLVAPIIVLSANTRVTNVVRASAQYWSHADATQARIDDDWTEEFWYKANSPPDPSYGFIHRQRSGENGVGVAIYRSSVNGDQIVICTGAGAFACDQGAGGTGIAKTIDTNWHHIRLQWVTETARVWIDGVQTNLTNDNQTAITPPNSLLAIGCDEGGTQCFNGQIDDFRIWNTWRATSTLSDRFCELTGNEPGLQFYLKFNGNGIDSSGKMTAFTNNNTATFPPNVPFEKSSCKGGPMIIQDL